MTIQEQEKFSQLLDQEEARLKRELSQVAEKNPNTGSFEPRAGFLDAAPDEEDVARETTDTENNMAVESNLERDLEAVMAAKEKLKKGTYGQCERCGIEIPAQRLEAVPSARFCLAHAK